MQSALGRDVYCRLDAERLEHTRANRTARQPEVATA